MLSNVEIREAIEAGQIGITPFLPENIQPASIDLTLADGFYSHYVRIKDAIRFEALAPRKNTRWIDPLDPEMHPFSEFCTVDKYLDGKIHLSSGRGFTLGCTTERVTLGPDIAAQVGGKSSLARLGIEVHLTAGFIDPGFDGVITLEMVNNGPDDILLTVGMPIAQLVFYRLGKPANPPYQGRYQGATGTEGSKYHIGRGS